MSVRLIRTLAVMALLFAVPAVTTLIVVVILYLFGGAALQGFSAVIIVGILVGTYSSIYIASALALDFGLKAEHVFPSERRRKIDDLP